jgi:hypothetical protein
MPFAEYFSIARQAEAAAIDSWYVEQAKSHDREQAETARCMQDAGFRWFVGELQKPESEIPSGSTLPIPDLPLDSADVAAYGYGRWTAGADEDSSETAEFDAYIESLGQDGAVAFYKALFDDPGCGKTLGGEGLQVDTSWYMGPVTAMQSMFVGAKDGEGVGSLMSEAAMQTLNSDWGVCMADKGVLEADDWRLDPDLAGPMNAFYIAVATGVDGSRVPADGSVDADVDHSSLTGSAAEMRIAVADQQCRVQTDYVNRFAALQFEAEAAWVSGHKAMLDQMVATWEQQEHK